MRPTTACLGDHDLLALAVGEVGSESLRAHLDACPTCRSRLERLRADLSALRLAGVGTPPSAGVSTASGPDASSAHDPAAESDSQSDTTTSWKEPPSATQPSSIPEHDPAGRDRDEPATWEETPIPPAIGKYMVIGRFARSGQAEVFRVVHPQFRRELVLKLALKPMGEDGRSEIVAEGRRLAELEHPNIVRVHDLDFHAGRPYLVMEYVRGRTLAQYAREEPVAPAPAAALVAELAGAVAFAHRCGIVHQDIKPGNVLIDETGRPRLIDFGLASQEDAWSGPGPRSEGGTFAYMAPEQARLEPDRIRPLSDVFALGALLYFLLTGQAPFAAATPDESWARARRGDLDRSALKKAGVPPPLEQICLKATAHRPQERYRSAAELQEVLRHPLRSRRVAITAATTCVLLVLGLWAAILVWGRLAPALPVPAPPTPSPPSPPLPRVAVSPVRIIRFDLEHLARRGEDGFVARGKLGEQSFAVQPADDVTVDAQLSEPAYYYLIAFRPDGGDEIFQPEDAQTPARKLQNPRYPPESQPTLVYRLEDGAGLHAFALVVSRAPLPSYRDWKDRHGTAPWQRGSSATPGVVWWYDGRRLSALTGDDRKGQRGQGATIRGGGIAVAGLAVWLKEIPGVDDVAVKAFLVPPPTGP
jgi:serine/threonine protein kinase